ncbi:2-C-methyl-D-erythritol 4-phosphate cytidylyltransferase [Nanoarchaeota archaeon]
MNIAIITAAGKGTRLNKFVNKIFLDINNKPIICRTIEAFEKCSQIDEIILVANQEDLDQLKNLVKEYEKIKNIVIGGQQRQDSVHNGIMSITNANDEDILLIHNGANPFVSEETISKCIEAGKEYGVAVAGIKSINTMKLANPENEVVSTLDRSNIYNIQTPQVLKYGIAKKVFEKAKEDGFYSTDDVSLTERLGYKVKIVESNQDNVKITYPNDIFTAENSLKHSRIGFGQDSHKFTDETKDLILGGVKFEDHKGLKANSDGDVIIHSLCNAISQAIGGKSLGSFADEMAAAGILDSREYLKKAIEMLKSNNYSINNIGLMIECKTPKIDPKSEDIKSSIAKICNIPNQVIGLTATTGESLSDFGKGLGIQVFSVISIKKND